MSCTQECTSHSGWCFAPDSGVRESFAWNSESWALGYRQNTTQGIRNLSNGWNGGIHVPLTKIPESSAWNPESMNFDSLTCCEMLCRDILAFNEIMVEPDLHVISVHLSKLNEIIDNWKRAQNIKASEYLIPLSTLGVIYVTGEWEHWRDLGVIDWYESQCSIDKCIQVYRTDTKVVWTIKRPGINLMTESTYTP